jgi:calcineurin-like phosphoesterase family protein
MKKWFTSDWHLGDGRIGIDGKPNLFYRSFRSIHEQNQTIIVNFRDSDFKDGDELWHLGDVIYDLSDEFYFESLRQSYPKSKFNLIVGNYDEDKLDILGKYFDNIFDSTVIHIGETIKGVFLNHYPIKCKSELWDNDRQRFDFAITGHIHGLWKVQKNMINVGVDAWHFKPVSEDEILFCWNAMQKFYDENVFPY